MLRFSSIVHSILPYQERKFRPEDSRNLYCAFATLSVHLPVIARQSKQYDTSSHSIFEALLQ